MQANRRMLYLGMALAWVPLVGLFFPIVFNMFHGILENKATGIAAVAGLWTESFAIFGMLAFVVAEVAGCAPNVFSGLTMACAALGLGVALLEIVWMMRSPYLR